ncbi:bifunctional lysylphosphatidylglycerol flippase/synthetase MprF [Arthrobacter sp.]|uniref:bifunctional lysylphosphatidylglycerol flippase/synthetase MprF n=1 Tax=Arthrobacter sp. TaxID=1667 RepID=UPI0026DF4864|nr:DUF2156 domain-containing protein [Arthrobacter sp.]MDO5753229.1 DUF2156 domain-containing protein [Arthrobacter sp.]
MTSEPVAASASKRRLSDIVPLLRKFPATAALVLLVIVATVATGGLSGGPAEDVLAAVGLNLDGVWGTWWTLLVSAFFAGSWLVFLLSLVTVAIGVGTAERTVGTWRAVAMFLLGSVVSAVVLSVVVAWGTVSNDVWLGFLGGNYVVGAFGGAATALGAATASLNNLWRHRVRTWLVASAIMFALYVGTAETLQFLTGAVVGVLAGRLLGTGRRLHTGKLFVRPSLREARFLLATIVGVFAIGPLLSQVTVSFAVGPLSTVELLMLQGRPDADELREMCDTDAACISLQSIAGVNSIGAVVLSMIPLLLLLMCSEGLRRGRRLALWTAVVINAVVAVVVLFVFVQFLVSAEMAAGDIDKGFLAIYILPAAVVPAGIAVLLLVNRGKFQVSPGIHAAKKLLRSILWVTVVVVALYGVVWFVEGNLGRLNIGDLLAQLVHILIPFPLPFVVRLPQGFMTVLVYGFGGAVVWVVFGVLAYRNLRLYSSATAESADGGAKVRELLQDGGGSLSWMALWENNSYWYSADGNNAVAYQVHNGVALTVSGPFGAVDGQGPAARNFVAYCVEQGLIPCFYSATNQVGEALEGLHFEALEVAEETLLNVEAMTFKGKEWQNVRTALNRASKLGIEDRWYAYSAMPPGIRAQLAEISEEWVSDKSLPEMGFTLGGLDELKDDHVLCCVAVDDDGLVHGVTSWLPVYTNREISGWTLDFMRRRTDGFKGVMEFLIASAVTHFKEEVPMISLSGSPLANAGEVTSDAEQSVVEKVLGMLGNALEPMYGFKSLAAFKSRFQPEHRTLYMFYQDPLALPAIGLAITAAYLPGLSARQSAGFLRQMTARESAQESAG